MTSSGGATGERPDPRRELEPGRHESVSARLSRIADTHPSRLALAGRGLRLSHVEVAERAAGFAKDLVDQYGVGQGDTVLFECGRDPALVWGLTGAIRTGAMFALIDAAFPDQRRQIYADTVRPKVVVRTSANELTIVSKSGWETTARSLQGPLASQAAYLTFTSGTTGQPKAVATTELPLVHFLDWYVSAFAIGASDRFAMLSGLGHDPLLRDILTPLCVGAALCVPPAEYLVNAERLRDWLAVNAVTIVHATPQLAAIVVDGCAAGMLSDLRLIVLGGAPLRWNLVDELRRVAPNAVVVNAYGATETPQIAACHVLSLPAARSERSTPVVPVGAGIDGVQLLVLDADGRLAETGWTGEICVRTPYLSLGYPADPVGTAQRFVPNPFSTNPSDRLYRTGDLGYYLPGGEVVLTGRADRQVKISGYRFELTELESAAASCEAVRDVFATWFEEETGSIQLVCAIVPKQPGERIATLLRAHLRSLLPSYAIPGRILVLERWPLTRNGKVDEARIRELAREGASVIVEREGSGSDTVEHGVFQIWARILDAGAASLDAEFIELGGNSLRALQIAGLLSRRFGVSVNALDVLTLRVARALADHIKTLVEQAQLEEEALKRELMNALDKDPDAVASLLG